MDCTGQIAGPGARQSAHQRLTARGFRPKGSTGRASQDVRCSRAKSREAADGRRKAANNTARDAAAEGALQRVLSHDGRFTCAKRRAAHGALDTRPNEAGCLSTNTDGGGTTCDGASDCLANSYNRADEDTALL